MEVEKEERMALQRTNQELSSGIIERSNSELRVAQTHVIELQAERDSIKEELNTLQMKHSELLAENARNNNAVEAARAQEKHYKVIYLFS